MPSTEDTRCSTVHIWCVLALFLIGLQYNHLIKLAAKIKTRGSSLGKLNGSKLGSNTLLRQLPSFWLFRAGLKLGAFPPALLFDIHLCSPATCVRGLTSPLLGQVVFCQLFAIQSVYLISLYVSISITLNTDINFAVAYFLTGVLGCSSKYRFR